mmetsp:Transcript_22373/g.43855  ORF Transcript_22373/g.43855 Transcript_22373/m.43855 type:complete len:276 (+) Transcript_22373:365-1192(+)
MRRFGFNLEKTHKRYLRMAKGLVGRGLADLDELGLERGTTNEEAVNVLLLDELVAVLFSDGATVEDTGLSSNLLRDVLLEPVAELGVDLLGLLGRGSLASANGPHGLVGKNHVAPHGLLLEGGEVTLHLLSDHRHGLTVLAVLELLTNAANDCEALGDGVGGLLTNEGAGLALLAALRVANNGELETKVHEHVSAGLASKGSRAGVPAILGTNHDLRAHVLANIVEVDHRGGHADLDVLAQSSAVEGAHDTVEHLAGAIELEVSAHEGNTAGHFA